MARVTLKMLSQKTGLAVSTISEILNGKKNFCSEETCRMVRDTAKALGYTPNMGFKIMTGRNTGIAAIIFSQRRTYFDDHNLKLSMMLLERLEKIGRSAYTAVMALSEEENLKKIRELISRGCREFFFIGAPVGDHAIYRMLKEEKLRRASYNGLAAPDCNIIADIGYANKLYMEHFLERKIDFICVTSEMLFERYFVEAIEALNLNPAKHFLEIPDLGHIQDDCLLYSHSMVQTALAGALPKIKTPTGWICNSDHEAMGALSVLQAAGHPVCDEGGAFVCGLGNSSVGKVSLVPINSADLRLEYVADTMLSGINENIYCRPEMIFRGAKEK